MLDEPADRARSPSAATDVSFTNSSEFRALQSQDPVLADEEFVSDLKHSLSLAPDIARTCGHNDRDDKATHLNDLQQIVGSFRANMAKMRKCLHVAEATDVPGCEGSMLELWRATRPDLANLPSDTWALESRLQRAFALADEAATLIGEAADLALEKVHAAKRPGPHEMAHLKYLIASLAEAYVRRGGKLGDRRSTFRQLLQLIHARLPTELRGQSPEAFGKFIYRTLKDHDQDRIRLSCSPLQKR